MRKLLATSLVMILSMGGILLLSSAFEEEGSNNEVEGQALVNLARMRDKVSTSLSAVKKSLPDITNLTGKGDKDLAKEDLVNDFEDAEAKAEYGVDRIMFMAFHNRPEVFKEALETYISANSDNTWKELKDKEGSGLLHWATMGECRECLKLLLERGFPVNQANSRGETALVYATSSGDEDLTEVLLAAGADPNVNFNEAGYSLLMDASFEGQIAVVKALVASNAALNKQDNDGMSPLHYAAKEGHGELVEFLISAGAKTKVVDQKGRTPLDYALQYHGKAFKSHFKAN